jgi:hypothetical protein
VALIAATWVPLRDWMSVVDRPWIAVTVRLEIWAAERLEIDMHPSLLGGHAPERVTKQSGDAPQLKRPDNKPHYGPIGVTLFPFQDLSTRHADAALLPRATALQNELNLGARIAANPFKTRIYLDLDAPDIVLNRTRFACS